MKTKHTTLFVKATLSLLLTQGSLLFAALYSLISRDGVVYFGACLVVILLDRTFFLNQKERIVIDRFLKAKYKFSLDTVTRRNFLLVIGLGAFSLLWSDKMALYISIPLVLGYCILAFTLEYTLYRQKIRLAQNVH